MSWFIGMSDADISTQTLAYTVNAAYEARITVEFTNRSTSASATASLWVVPAGEGVANEHIKESGTTLGLAGTPQAVLVRRVIAPAGSKVYVQASSANVSCQLSGDVVSPDNTASALTTAITAATQASAITYTPSGTGAVSRSVSDDLLDDFRVSRFMSAAQIADARGGTGALDSTTTFQTAVTAAAVLATAGSPVVITVPRGVYQLSGAVTVSTGNIQFDFQDVIIKQTGSASFAAFDFEGVGVLGTPVLNANAARSARVVMLTSLGSLAAGGYLMLSKNAPNNGGATALYRDIIEVKTITGAGPYTVTLVSPLSVAFATADAGLELKTISMIENVGISGNVKFDASAATGTTVHGVKAQYVRNSKFSGYRGVDLDAGSALYAQYGLGNTFKDGQAEGCGNASYAPHFIIAQTHFIVDSLRVYDSANFGTEVQSCCNGTVISSVGEGAVAGRLLKLAACLEVDVFGSQGHGSDGGNGVAVSIGTCYCNFFGVHANGNDVSEGMWFSDQSNCDNNVYGLLANGNTGRDLYLGDTDLRNSFHGGKIGVIYIGGTNATNWFHGVNNIPLMGGNSGNAPVTMIAKSPTANFLALQETSGAAAEGWIGTTGTGDNTYVNGKVLSILSVNNVAQLSLSSTTISAVVKIVPSVTNTTNLGGPSNIWAVGYIQHLILSGYLRTAVPVTVTAATHTVADTSYSIIYDRAGTVTVTMPAAASYSGRILNFRTITANAVVSAASDVVPLAGGAAGTAILPATAGAHCMLQSDGTNWQIMSSGV